MKRKERLRRSVVLKKGLLEASDSDSDEDSSSSDGGSSDDSERTPEPSCPQTLDMPIARRKRSTVGVSPLRHAARMRNTRRGSCSSGLSVINEDEKLKGMIVKIERKKRMPPHLNLIGI